MSFVARAQLEYEPTFEQHRVPEDSHNPRQEPVEDQKLSSASKVDAAIRSSL
jgi:hypothetical protein